MYCAFSTTLEMFTLFVADDGSLGIFEPLSSNVSSGMTCPNLNNSSLSQVISLKYFKRACDIHAFYFCMIFISVDACYCLRWIIGGFARVYKLVLFLFIDFVGFILQRLQPVAVANVYQEPITNWNLSNGPSVPALPARGIKRHTTSDCLFQRMQDSNPVLIGDNISVCKPDEKNIWCSRENRCFTKIMIFVK